MRIGFIGMGNMGASIARDLAASEHELSVFDVREDVLAEFRQLGAHIGATPAEVASRSEVVGICVRTDEQVLDVLRGDHGVYAGAKPGLVVAIHSTIHIDTLTEIRGEAEPKGVRIVDAPVSRGTNAPRTQAINFMLGGAPEDVEKAAAYVKPAALAIVKTGESGSALILKICNNVLTYLGAIMLRDVFRLAKGSGVDLSKLAELVASNGVGSPNMLYSINRKAGGPAQTHHTIDVAEVNAMLGEKDLSCALEAAAAIGVDVPAIAFARQEIRQTMYEL